jgi:hypothetical protein
MARVIRLSVPRSQTSPGSRALPPSFADCLGAQGGHLDARPHLIDDCQRSDDDELGQWGCQAERWYGTAALPSEDGALNANAATRAAAASQALEVVKT